MRQTIISTRPSTDVDFFKHPENHQQLLDSFKSSGKIVSRVVTYSEDGLSETSDTIFASVADFQDLRNSDSIKETTVLRRQHNAMSGIKVSVTVTPD
jgi:hypothetical protein